MDPVPSLSAATEFQIPTRSGETLCLPPARQLLALAKQNAARLANTRDALAGLPLSEVRRRARAEALQVAAAYTHRIGLTVPAPRPSDLVLVAGHQPFLFHPGIWLKHLLINRLAGEGVAAVSMPVDHDTPEDIGADAPQLDETGLRVVRETLIRLDGAVPFEAVPAPSAATWRDFVDRLQAHLRTLPLPDAQSVLEAFARAATPGRSEDIGTFLTAARRRYEGSRNNIELPVSRVSPTEEFRRFALSLLRDAARFAEVYNSHLRAYRKRYNIRTSAQPFPDLQREADRQEAPFWIVTRGRRTPVFVRRARSHLQILADSVPVRDVADGAGSEALEDLALRPRALTLTAFTRLCLADLFVHGVGGGHYDRVTDGVIREYFGIDPPAYAVATGTLHLPLQTYDAATERQLVQRRLLELEHNPDRVLQAPTPQQQAIIAEKWRLIGALDGKSLSHAERRQATQRIREINAELSRSMTREREEVERRLAQVRAGTEATAAATHREYPYCFFSPGAVETLIDRMFAE